MEFLLLVAAGVAIFFLIQRNKARAEIKVVQEAQKKAEQEVTDVLARQVIEREHLQAEIASLAQYQEIRDTAQAADDMRRQAKSTYDQAVKEAQAVRDKANQEAATVLDAAKREAEMLRRSANDDAKAKQRKSEVLLAGANLQVQQILQEANKRAEEIAGDAYRALKDADALKEVANAMKNVIEGYGDAYLKPTYSLLDELADAYGFDEAGQQLKLARERSKLMVDHGRAATCDYAEKIRKDTAIRFVLDAFNGKVDSILSRSRSDNIGTLEQQIKDAYALVNNNGAAFRNARINHEYLDARLAELKWAAAAQALRERDKEEQRRIREQIREEEKAQREIERALKEAARDEEALQKAMEKVQAQAAKANDAQRAEFDAKLADLQAKLAEAEARSQRALSMAQQTKAGHVYVISNIGSFGEDIFKVGMTRRLEPLDRIRELGDASVPFEFDVHAMIWCEDAPALENELHKRFVQSQINKVNPRKEFFKLSLANLRKEVEAMGIESSWTMAAQALEYRESQAIEAKLKDNPNAAQDWLRHQLDYAVLKKPELVIDET